MDHSHMDHSKMDHGGMDHGGMDHGGHGGGGGSGPMCNMNMLFTWDTTNLCIVFRQWHVTGTVSLVFSLLAIVAICAGYEALREATRKYELWLANQEGARNIRNDLRHRRRRHDEDGQYGDEEAPPPPPPPPFRDDHDHDHDHDHEQEEDGERRDAENNNTALPFLGIERIVGSSSSGHSATEAAVSQRARVLKAVLYGVQNFYAFMIMLLFMTYNGYVMIAVAVGAGVGYYAFGSHTRATKETACH
ncbi:Ctr copper transporter family-domain-containing protein [Xylariaceae sp. FL0594]|nr:Ctr copper transporter family-domain-containing protein [Xylariaceae sp. FL0594]